MTYEVPSISFRTATRGAAACGLALFASTGAALAAEGGVGFYLLGSKGPYAGVLAPPGTYINNDLYFYTGNASASESLSLGGEITADVDAIARLDVLTGMWVLPNEVLGGNLAFTLSLPFGYQDVKGKAAVAGTALEASVNDDVFTMGDPVLGATLGWHSGNLHWTTGALVNVPIGDYHEGDLANIAFNRWGLDLTGAMTWFDPATGWEVSGAAGFTFNGENPETDYRTGTEFHFETAVTKTFPSTFSAGLVGYYYEQISEDSGSGATLGDFKGRVSALGATFGYNFQMGNTPVSMRLRVLQEFEARNRLEGTAAFLTLSFPLGG
ncbi:SphA family protein [Salipiger thiooxidans]|uniref:SphA family protein n=1 Tax=Salipiger thiooxidans TaxID=282683 RepID=UPI001CD3E805|nr:transporter [Salipiger thiooxidans]MCA0846011.1 transporter [Salipiger thiooxidans]